MRPADCRRLDEAGATFRLAHARTAAEDIDAFVRLHVGRWEDRNGSRSVSPLVAAFLRAAGPGLVASGRMRIWSLDLDGVTIGSSVVLRAGGELGYWLSGFETAHAALEPSKVAMDRVIQDAFELGAARLDSTRATPPTSGAFPTPRRYWFAAWSC